MVEIQIDYKKLYEQVLTQNEILKKEIEQLSEHLKKYTAPIRSKKYYETHKEELIEKSKEYNKIHKRIIDPEKVKEYNKKAYQKRKQKQNENK